MRFSEIDRDSLQRMGLDPRAEPSFEIMKACLVWPDERPVQISKEGYELVGDLWIVRGYIHRGVPMDQWGLDPAYFKEVWSDALREIPEWLGFKRLFQTDADREYLTSCLAEASTQNDY